MLNYTSGKLSEKARKEGNEDKQRDKLEKRETATAYRESEKKELEVVDSIREYAVCALYMPLCSY